MQIDKNRLKILYRATKKLKYIFTVQASKLSAACKVYRMARAARLNPKDVEGIISPTDWHLFSVGVTLFYYSCPSAGRKCLTGPEDGFETILT